MWLKSGWLFIVGLILSVQLVVARNDNVETTEASYLQQIFILKQLAPEIKKIGVLCQIKNYKDLETKLGRLQKQAQLEFVLYNIKNMPDVAKHAKNATISKNVDALWVFADEILLDPKTQSYLVKYSLQSKIVLLSAEPEIIKKGGTVCIRKGTSKPVIFLNQKAVDLLTLSIPPGLPETAEVIIF